MIDNNEIRRIAGEESLDVSMLEKDYVLGWILYGISKSSIGNKLAFKGGTALSKIYFPGKWRLSEDLDFTLIDDIGWGNIIDVLKNEVPGLVQDAIGISISLRPKPHTNPDYLQAKMKYIGPVNPNTVKIEVTREKFQGELIEKLVPKKFDYPQFSVKVYSLENIIAEKTRAIIERGYIRDYYDVWRLLKTQKHDRRKTKELFLEKCKANGITYTGIDQFFPKNIVTELEKYLDTGLTRLSREPLPPLQKIIDELKKILKEFLE